MANNFSRTVRTLILLCIAAAFAACGGGDGGEGGGAEGQGGSDQRAGTGRLLFSDSFDTCSASPGWGQTLLHDPAFYEPNTSQSTFQSRRAHNGNCAGNYYAVDGTNERTPWQIGMDAARLTELFGALPDEIYMEWWEFYDSDYPFASSSQKVVRWGYADPNHEESRKSLTVMIQSRNADLNMQYFCGSAGESLCSVDGAVHSNQPMPLDRWVKLGLWIKLNSPGSIDGFLRLYRDDQLLIEGVDLDLRGEDDRGFDYFWLGGNYSMTSGTISGSGNRYIDDFALYTSFPG